MSGPRTDTHCSSMSSFKASETTLGSVVNVSTSCPKLVGEEILERQRTA